MEHSPGFLRLVEESKKAIKETTIQEIQARLARGEKFHLVDVREDHEWEKGRIPGARHLGRGILERDIEAAVPDRGAELVLYCGGGFRSALFTCLTEEGIPPDNNHAERVLRKLVVQRKISGGNRSPTHAAIHARMMSVLETMRLDGGDLVATLQTLFTSRIAELSRQ